MDLAEIKFWLTAISETRKHWLSRSTNKHGQCPLCRSALSAWIDTEADWNEFPCDACLVVKWGKKSCKKIVIAARESDSIDPIMDALDEMTEYLKGCENE